MKHLKPYLIKANAHLEKAFLERPKEEEKKESLFTSKGEILGVYPPFAASFGAAIIRSGLLPAIFLYAEKSGGGTSKAPLMSLILDMVKEESKEAKDLKKYVMEEIFTDERGNEITDKQIIHANTTKLKKRILDASVAAKLALRTYPVEDKNKTQ